MTRIFLCHANEDKPQVEAIYIRLQAEGFEPWMDKKDLIPGQNWQQEIPRALRTSTLVLVLLSSRIGRPGYVQREFKLAVEALQEIPDGMIHTIPVRLEPCNVPEQFASLQWCDLFEADGFERLVGAIRYGFAQRGKPLPPASASAFTNWIGMEFVLIPAGTFMMGSPDSDGEAFDDEKPAHRVTISQPFYVGKYPVTQAQWEAVMGDNPSHFKGNPDHPVEQVSWNDVQGFLHRLNEQDRGKGYRLPTEAQWEYACRAGTATPRYHSDIDAIAWYEANNNRQSHPVGQKVPNAWGLYDMLGNVYEWCHDGKRSYPVQRLPGNAAKALVDPMGPLEAGARRAIRGGGWFGVARYARAALRVADPPAFRYRVLGFRCSSSGPSK